MILNISLTMDNAAFGDDSSRGFEAAMILRGLANKLASEGAGLLASGPLRDGNGNTVGTWEVQG